MDRSLSLCFYVRLDRAFASNFFIIFHADVNLTSDVQKNDMLLTYFFMINEVSLHFFLNIKIILYMTSERVP